MDAAASPTERRGVSFASRAKRWAKVLLLAYVGFLVMLWGLQRKLLYHPGAPTTEAAQEIRAAADGLAPWHDEQGAFLGWKRERPGAPAMLVFHGNAGLASQRLGLAQGLYRAGWSVHLLEYPGYGGRPGSPSRAALVAAGLEATERLAKAGPVFLLGESVGSGVACAVAAAQPKLVKGLLLVTPFARLAEVAGAKLPWVPVKLLMIGEDYDNRAALARYQGPTAVLVAGQDEVVGAEQGRSLHAEHAGPKRLWEQPRAGHNTLDLDPDLPWWGEASAFLRVAAAP